MVKSKVYVFKVALKHRKGTWRRIEIKGNQKLGDLDQIIREAFNHEDCHLSEFFQERCGDHQVLVKSSRVERG